MSASVKTIVSVSVLLLARLTKANIPGSQTTSDLICIDEPVFEMHCPSATVFDVLSDVDVGANNKDIDPSLAMLAARDNGQVVPSG